MISKPPIPLKLYKHFAVTTLSLTAAIAMFADDNSRSAMAEDFEERRTQGEIRRASAAQFTEARLIRNDSQFNRSSFGTENAGYGGRPVNPTGNRAASRRSSGNGGRPPIPGYDQEIIDGLSEEDYYALLQSLPDELRRGATSDFRNDRMRQMERASASRSGHNGSSADAPG